MIQDDAQYLYVPEPHGHYLFTYEHMPQEERDRIAVVIVMAGNIAAWRQFGEVRTIAVLLHHPGLKDKFMGKPIPMAHFL
jgi:hypothetical protein